MKSTTALTALIAGLAGEALAFPQYSEQVGRRADPNAWQAPGSGDVRAPCPGLNTLANHGYINRNGKNVTKQAMQQGFLDAFGLDFPITDAGANNAANLQCNGCTSFDLDTLNQPHAIEHDGSMTRLDKEMGWSKDCNNYSFNQTQWDSALDMYGCNTHANIQLTNHVRLTRANLSQATDWPGWYLSGEGGSAAEHGFMLCTMHDTTLGNLSNPQMRLDWVNYWFTNERLPTELGWQKPSPVSGDTYNSVLNVLNNAPSTTLQSKSVCAPTSSASASASASNSANSTAPAKTTASTGTSSVQPSLTSAPFPAGNSTSALGSGTGTAPASQTAGPTTTSSTSTTSSTLPASVTSSAESKATQLAGPAPAQPNPYNQVLSNDQWNSFSTTIVKYVSSVQSLCSALLGSHEVGSVGGGSGAPWYASAAPASMGSMAAAPSASTVYITASPAAASTATVYITTGVSPAQPTGLAGAAAPGTCTC